jgi:DNA-binding transcriptional LysR family regulator
MFFDGRAEGDLTHHKLLDDPYVVVARPGVFPPGPVRPEDLDDVPMVAYPLECDQPRVERELARAGVRPRFVFRTAGNEAILSMVRAGIGSALLPRLAVHSVTELVVHPLEPALRPREIYLLWQAGRSHSPLAARAIEIAVEIADGMWETPGRRHG